MKITKEQLLEEMKIALSDEFEAEVLESEGRLTIEFGSGQTFDVSVEEK